MGNNIPPVDNSTANPAALSQISPPSLLAEGFSETQRACKPKIEFEIVSMREIVNTMPIADREKLEAIVEADPSLIEARTAAINANPSLVDISPGLAAQIAESIGSSLSAEARPALKTIVDFYFGYLRPFPDITETEPLSSLLGYIRDNPNWDVLMAKGTSGAIVGACSGQIVDVPFGDRSFKIAWNEHTWVDKEARRSGVGETLAGIFAEDARKAGSIGVVIETDNPYLITKDPRAFDHANPEARAEFWTSTTEGLGQSMDPFQRFKFWGRQGFGVICSGNPATPFPYTQIAMVLGEVGSCETINLAFLPSRLEYAKSMPKDMYLAALVALQNTIDEHSSLYPEMVRTIKQIEAVPGDTLHFVALTDPSINEVLERACVSKSGAAERDLAYCNERLQHNDLSSEEREILSQSREYLIKNLEQ